jgi:hypothetical protein
VDISAAREVGVDTRAACGANVDVGATRGGGRDVGAVCGAGWGTGATRGRAIVSEVPATKEG